MRFLSLILALVATMGFGYEDEYSKIAREQRESFNIDVIVQEIVDSVKDKDTSVIEGYMCQNIKDNVEDLPAEIKKLMDAIPGEITSWEREFGGYSGTDKDGKGGILQESSYTIFLNTTEGKYALGLYWSIVNTCYPEETGIRLICIYDPQAPVQETEDGQFTRPPMAIIRATEKSPYTNPNPPTVREDNKKMIEYIISCIKGTA